MSLEDPGPNATPDPPASGVVSERAPAPLDAIHRLADEMMASPVAAVPGYGHALKTRIGEVASALAALRDQAASLKAQIDRMHQTGGEMASAASKEITALRRR